MMKTIDYVDVSETQPHEFHAEASSLGLPPGMWPPSLATRMGNSLPFVRSHLEADLDGELLWVEYRQAAGCITLRVFND